jgi:hypothetical protein
MLLPLIEKEQSDVAAENGRPAFSRRTQPTSRRTFVVIQQAPHLVGKFERTSG